MAEKTYTRAEVVAIINAGADLVQADPIGEGERDHDLINVVVNVQVAMLDDPGITMDEALNDNYEAGADEVRSWWDGWA